jgi:hypothetical protein
MFGSMPRNVFVLDHSMNRLTLQFATDDTDDDDDAVVSGRGGHNSGNSGGGVDAAGGAATASVALQLLPGILHRAGGGGGSGGGAGSNTTNSNANSNSKQPFLSDGYALCHHTVAKLSAVDYALLSNLAYLDG